MFYTQCPVVSASHTCKLLQYTIVNAIFIIKKNPVDIVLDKFSWTGILSERNKMIQGDWLILLAEMAKVIA